MIKFLVSVVVILLCGFVAHEGIKIGNKHIKDLDMSPNIGAIIGMIRRNSFSSERYSASLPKSTG